MAIGEQGVAGTRTAPDVVGALASSIVGPAAGLITAPVLARVLGPHGRGVVAAAVAFVIVGAGLASAGALQAVMVFGTSGHHWAATAAAMRRPMVACIAVIVTAALLHIPPFVPGQATNAVIVCVALPAVVAADLLRAGATGGRLHRSVNFERTAQAGTRLSLLLILAFAGALQATTATAAILVANVLGVCWFGLSFVASLRHGAGNEVEMRAFRQYRRRASLGSVSNIALSRLDQMLLAVLAPTAQLGFYAAVVTIAEVPRLIGTAIYRVALTDSMYKRDLRLVWSLSRLTLSGTSIVVLLALPVTRPAVLILLGGDFAPSVWPLRLLLIGVVPYATATVLGAGLLASGQVRWWSWANAAGVLVTVVALVALAPALGALGAAMASVLAYAVVFAIVLGRLAVSQVVSVRDLLLPRASDVRQVVAFLRTRAG